MATKAPVERKKSNAPSTNGAGSSMTRALVFDVFRRWGYLQAQLDPLQQYLPAEPFPADIPEDELASEIAQEARGYYCNTIAAEFMHIPSPEKRAWIQERMERPAPKFDEKRILSLLIRADMFEQVIQSRYLGAKRFSLEGLCALIPFMDQIFETSSKAGVETAVIGMAHRGRLNVMTNTIGRGAVELFTKFEDVDPRSTLGGGDVKYHLGATGTYTSPDGKKIALHLASNPSHLEVVNPVVHGRARAKQARIGKDGEKKVLPIVIHGDAAFAGQGLTAETINLANINGYNIGGTLQILTNNLLGFTAMPHESNSSRYSTDLAKRLPIPIFHVNAEDLTAVARVAEMAAEYRAKFGSDVVVDLVGYRKHGHSEVDDPTVTQPRRYALIKDRPAIYQAYAKTIGVDPTAEAKTIQEEFLEAQKQATQATHLPHLSEHPKYWEPYKGGYLPVNDDTKTGLPAERIAELVAKLTRYPADFNIHPKVKALLAQRAEMGEGKRPFDYGMAELVAYASLLEAGTRVRLSGQDSQRGTFNHRHSFYTDTETEFRWSPLQHLSDGQAEFEAYNSMLSEAAVLGFEYGFSRDFPEALTLWEAQFGDFSNGAQMIIDQFISAAEAKWHLLSGVVMLLPHGYEGQGPEHSSARMERYLQLCAQDNMIVTQPSNAAQYFHLLRRQALSPYRKPLVVFTPKSMLRHPDAISPIADFSAESFKTVLPDGDVKDAKRLLICSGKIGHNLRVERAKRKDTTTGIIFVEQLFPWPEKALQDAIAQHPNVEELVWVQEEPGNMGPLTYINPKLRYAAGDIPVRTVTRAAAASPATGSAKAHEIEEKLLIEIAFGSK